MSTRNLLAISLLTLVSAASLAACGQGVSFVMTPTARITNTPITPTLNFGATETIIVSHAFATLTALAPKVTPTLAPTLTPAPTQRATRAPTPRVVTKATNPSQPQAGPSPTSDPYLNQIPKDKGGLLIINYFGNRVVNFSIAGKAYQIPSNDKLLIVLDPDKYTFSVQVPGMSGCSWSDSIAIIADGYQPYPISECPNQ